MSGPARSQRQPGAAAQAEPPTIDDLLDGSGWEERLQEARKKREQALARLAKDRPADPAPADDAPSGVPSLDDIMATPNLNERFEKARRLHDLKVARRGGDAPAGGIVAPDVPVSKKQTVLFALTGDRKAGAAIVPGAPAQTDRAPSVAGAPRPQTPDEGRQGKAQRKAIWWLPAFASFALVLSAALAFAPMRSFLIDNGWVAGPPPGAGPEVGGPPEPLVTAAATGASGPGPGALPVTGQAAPSGVSGAAVTLTRPARDALNARPEAAPPREALGPLAPAWGPAPQVAGLALPPASGPEGIGQATAGAPGRVARLARPEVLPASTPEPAPDLSAFGAGSRSPGAGVTVRLSDLAQPVLAAKGPVRPEPAESARARLMDPPGSVAPAAAAGIAEFGSPGFVRSAAVVSGGSVAAQTRPVAVGPNEPALILPATRAAAVPGPDRRGRGGGLAAPVAPRGFTLRTSAPVPRPVARPARVDAPVPAVEGVVVRVHAPASVADEDLAALQDALGATGYPVADPKRVDFQISRSNVRYYHQRDLPAARELADAAGAVLRDFTGFRPSPPEGTVELWVKGPASKRAPARAARKTSRRRQASQPDALATLRDRLVRRLQNRDYLPNGGN